MNIHTKIRKFRQLWKASSFALSVSQLIGGIAVWPSFNKKKHVTNFSTNIDVYRVVSMVTNAIKKIPVVVYEGRGDDRKQLNDHELAVWLREPNRYQNWQEFLVSAISMKMITGDGYIYAPIHIDGANRNKPSEMFVMPSQHMTIVPEKDTLNILKYQLQLGVTKDFPTNEVIHWKEFNPNVEGDGRSLYGMSKLFPGGRTIAVSDESQTSQKQAYQNSGASGLITYNGDNINNAPVGVTGRAQMNEDWEDQYTGSINQGKTIWLNFDAKWQQIGMSPVDLKTIESQQHTLNGIAGLYNVPMELVNPLVKKAYQSPREARRSLYTEAAIPEYIEFIQALSKFLVPLFAGGRDIWLWYDTSQIEALQMDKKAQWEWVGKMWELTPNQRLEAMGFPVSDNPQMNVVWTPTGIIPIDFDDISKPIKE